ncbi:MAG: endonuclease I [Desulfobulbaceae bacterium]|nr:endonuclease I [Desulfobulbaceae bacterium]
MRCLMLFKIAIILLAATQAYAGGNTTIDSFSKAKKLLLKQVYHDHRTTFYCGCPFTAKKRIIQSDKFSPTTKYVKRSRKIEWEHVVPAQAFGQSFSEWRDGDPECVNKKGKAFKGRKCAEKVNMTYRYMQADLYNLVPANGQVNALRSNYSYAMIPGEPRVFGSCDMEIEDRKAEPRPEIRGDIARIYFYMDKAYPGRGIIGKKNREMLKAWDKADPVDDWERERCRRIERLQGNRNGFVE